MNYEGEPQFNGGFEMKEQNKPEVKVITLAEHGLGYGDGPIGVQNRLENEADPLTSQDVAVVREITLAGEALVPVDADEHGKMLDDDGCGDGRAQVFVVDAWRMLDVIDRNKFIPEDKKEQAFIAELIYSLGVSATLTKGDLPVDLIMPGENS